MPSIREIPIEILTSIFEYLGATDLISLLVSQRVCRQFRSVSQHALQRLVAATEKVASNTTIQERFSSILDYSTSNIHSYHSDCPESAFRKLPWAQDAHTRAPCICPDSSWRSLSVTWGSLPITHLEIIKMCTIFGPTRLDHYYVDVPASGLTLGAVYDLILSSECYESDTAKWELMVGKWLTVYDDFHQLRVNGSDSDIPKDDVMEILVADGQASRAAVLFIEGFRDCTGPDYTRHSDQWAPKIMGQETLKCLRWQGPLRHVPIIYDDDL
jgi:hypothetical protein